jgi:hypothetical protein
MLLGVIIDIRDRRKYMDVELMKLMFDILLLKKSSGGI